MEFAQKGQNAPQIQQSQFIALRELTKTSSDNQHVKYVQQATIACTTRPTQQFVQRVATVQQAQHMRTSSYVLTAPTAR